MNRGSRRGATAGLALPLMLLSGCLFTTRKLPVPKQPTVVQTAGASELVDHLNQRWSALNSLYANVEIQASRMNSSEGVEKDYTSFPGIIMFRKPEMLRVVGFVPVLHTRMFDMVSDGHNFTLYVPSKELAYKGANELTHQSSNTVENMRPGFFLDALMVRGLAPEDEYMVTTDSHTVEDAKKKHLLLIPEYILTAVRRKPGSQELRTIRTIHFHRDDLLPYQQELYDAEGNPETQVTYGPYADFDGNKFPSTVTIRRPKDEFQIVLRVEKVKQNIDLKDDQFQIQIPEHTKIQNLQ